MWRMGFKYTTITLCLIFSNISTLSAQQFSHLYELYAEKKLSLLEDEVKKLNNNSDREIDLIFFHALFIEDGDQAIKIYEQLINRAAGLLKKYTAKKISEYYYARGFYVKAAQYENIYKKINISNNQTLKKSENGKTDSLPSDNLVIQVGAFGSLENASKLKNMLAAKEIKVRVVKRIVQNKNLYCVWIDGKNNFEETREYAELLKRNFRLTYSILRP
jgi:hypothetical protein